MYMYMFVHMLVYVHVYVYVYVRGYVYAYAHVYVYGYVCACVCVYMFMCWYLFAWCAHQSRCRASKLKPVKPQMRKLFYLQVKRRLSNPWLWRALATAVLNAQSIEIFLRGGESDFVPSES